MAGENGNDLLAKQLLEANKKAADNAATANALSLENKNLHDKLNATEKERDGLKVEVETLTAVNEDLQAKLTEVSEKTLEDMAAESQEAEVLEIPTESFNVNKKEYVFVVPVFSYNKQRITAKAALADKELQAHLVKIGSGVIKAK